MKVEGITKSILPPNRSCGRTGAVRTGPRNLCKSVCVGSEGNYNYVISSPKILPENAQRKIWQISKHSTALF